MQSQDITQVRKFPDQKDLFLVVNFAHRLNGVTHKAEHKGIYIFAPDEKPHQAK